MYAVRLPDACYYLHHPDDMLALVRERCPGAQLRASALVNADCYPYIKLVFAAPDSPDEIAVLFDWRD